MLVKAEAKKVLTTFAVSALLATSFPALFGNGPVFSLWFCLLFTYLKNPFLSFSSHHSWSRDKVLSSRVSNSHLKVFVSLKRFPSSRIVVLSKA